MAIPLEKLYAIAETLSISITDLLIEEDEGSRVENELPDLIKEYKEIESQELRNVLIKSLFEGIRICEEKVKRAERIKVARDLVKGGISMNIILGNVQKSVSSRIFSSTQFSICWERRCQVET